MPVADAGLSQPTVGVELLNGGPDHGGVAVLELLGGDLRTNSHGGQLRHRCSSWGVCTWLTARVSSAARGDPPAERRRRNSVALWAEIDLGVVKRREHRGDPGRADLAEKVEDRSGADDDGGSATTLVD